MGRNSVSQAIAGTRPYPVDKDRQNRIFAILHGLDLTQSEMAVYLQVDKAFLSRVISGRQPSPSLEKRIAMFLGVPEVQLFPVRTAGDIARMREAEEMAKSRKASLRQARLAARANAGGVA